MRRGLAIVALVSSAGCDSILRLDPIKPLPPVVSYRKPITITNPTGTTLTDEPVSITTVMDADLVAHARADGSDLVFDDGTSELASEIVEYHDGTLDAWVRTPTLPNGATTIYLSYGGAARMAAATDTWSNAYAGVWHLSGSAATSPDSTQHRNDLTAQVGPPAAMPGIVGGARSFDVNVIEPMCGLGDGSLEFDALTSFAYSAWVYVPSTPPGVTANIPLHKGGSSATTAGFDLELGGLAWHAYISDGMANMPPMVEPSTNEVLGRWADVVIVVDRGGRLLLAYLDGGAADSFALASGFGALSNLGEPFCLGGEPTNNPFGGLVDEVRVVRGVPTNAQIRFRHANLAERGSVIAIGAEEPVLGP